MTLTVLIVALVQSAKDNHHIGLLCLLNGLGNQLVGRAHLVERATYRHAIIALNRIAHVTTGKVNLCLLETTADAIEGQDLLLHLQRRGASANGHHLNGILAHHQDTLRLLQRQHATLVLQQNDTLLGNLQGRLVMTLRTEESIRLMVIHRGTIEQTEHTTNLLVEFLRRVLPLLNKLLIRQSQIVVVVGIGGTHRQTIGPGSELEVESVGDSLVGIVASAPVADNHAIIAPVLFEDLVQENMIVAIVLVFIKIVGAHDTPSTCLSHSSLEGGQIDLVQGTVGDDDVHLMTILFIVVQRIMLHACCYALRLQSLDIRNHHA